MGSHFSSKDQDGDAGALGAGGKLGFGGLEDFLILLPCVRFSGGHQRGSMFPPFSVINSRQAKDKRSGTAMVPEVERSTLFLERKELSLNNKVQRNIV